jgi:ubiquitin C-terminal hydrolase
VIIPSEGIVEVWAELKKPISGNLVKIFSSNVTENINRCILDTTHSFGKDSSLSIKRVSLLDCLKEELNKETVLDQGNMWNCPSCE